MMKIRQRNYKNKFSRINNILKLYSNRQTKQDNNYREKLFRMFSYVLHKKNKRKKISNLV